MGAYLAIKSKNLFTTESFYYRQCIDSYIGTSLNSFTAITTNIVSTAIVEYKIPLAVGSYKLSFLLTSIGAPSTKRPNEVFIFSATNSIIAFKSFGADDVTKKECSLSFSITTAQTLRVSFYLNVMGSPTDRVKQTMTCENIMLAKSDVTEYEPYYTYKRVKALAVTGNKFDINGGYIKNGVNISIDGNKIVNTSVAGGWYEYISFSEVYPAGTYKVTANVDTNDSQKNYRPVIVTTGTVEGKDNNAVSYLASYGGYYVAFVDSGKSFTFTTTEAFSLKFIIGVNTSGSSKTIYDITLQRIGAKCTLRMSPTTLPDGYQRVEYIESTGTQYIDTGYYPNEKTNATIDFEFFQSDTGEWKPIMAVRQNRNGTNFSPYAFFAQGNTSALAVNYGGLDTGMINGVNVLGRHTLGNKGSNIYVDNTLVKTIQGHYETFTATNSLPVFALKNMNGDIETRNIHGRLYYLNIREGDKLVRHYIPCYRKSDEEIGLLDIVSGVFFTNQGTGEFKKGADV